MRETWYVLEDGSVADPNECAPDEAGKLAHKSGAAVAMRGHVPSSRGVDADEERAKASVKKAEKTANEARDDGKAPVEAREVVAEKPETPAKNREIKAAGAKKYQTR
jgi:hypothetical protein